MKLFNPIIDGLQKDMDPRPARQRTLNMNIATTETPDYRPVDLNFRDALRRSIHTSGEPMSATQARPLDDPSQEPSKTPEATSPTNYPECRTTAAVTDPAASTIHGNAVTAEAASWWETAFTPGIKQRFDPEGLGYQTVNQGPPPDGFDACDRRQNPAIITTQTAFEGDKQLSSRGVYDGPGYYLIGADDVCRKVWGPDDMTQRPGEDTAAWIYRTGQAPVSNNQRAMGSATNQASATQNAQASLDTSSGGVTGLMQGPTANSSPHGQYTGFNTKDYAAQTYQENASAFQNTATDIFWQTFNARAYGRAASTFQNVNTSV